MRKIIPNQGIKKFYKLSIGLDSICSMLQIKFLFIMKSILRSDIRSYVLTKISVRLNRARMPKDTQIDKSKCLLLKFHNNANCCLT